MNRFRIWIFSLCFAVMIGLGTETKASAESIPSPNFMIGYYDPSEPAGYETFADEAPSTLNATVTDSQYAAEVVRLINLRRTDADLAPLIVNPILTEVALAHSEYMRDHSCFDHQCPGEPSPQKRACLAGYRPYSTQISADFDINSMSGTPPPGSKSCYVGETIAAGYPSPKSVVKAWMDSPGHHAILMHSKMKEIGLGYAVGGYYRRYWTADLGSQPNKLYVFINDDDPVTESRRVTLTMTNEEVSNSGGIGYAQEMMISNDPQFADADWEDYTVHKPWMLTAGKGPKTVYVKFRDAKGYEILSGDIIFVK